MPEENVAVVARFLGALVQAQESGDWDAVLVELDPEVEIDDYDITLDMQHYTGHEGFREWLSVWNESWQSWRVDDVEILPAGDDKVLSLFRMIATGQGSGIEIDRRDGVASTLCDGKITAIAYYNDPQQAREAVGLQA